MAQPTQQILTYLTPGALKFAKTASALISILRISMSGNSDNIYLHVAANPSWTTDSFLRGGMARSQFKDRFYTSLICDFFISSFKEFILGGSHCSMLICMSVTSGLNWALLFGNQGDSLLNILSMHRSHILCRTYRSCVLGFLSSEFITLYLVRTPA